MADSDDHFEESVELKILCNAAKGVLSLQFSTGPQHETIRKTILNGKFSALFRSIEYI
ncbi:hypothetical protein QUF90_23270 [Desulfococcaceae bacterium HSG9]|nr:hypothetical protein [Desulfococcaceae bacterium HSG9]